MKGTNTALLVSEQGEPCAALVKLFEDQGFKTHLVQRVSEARAYLDESPPLAAVFSGTALDDGTWADVVFWAARASSPVPVIVVSGNENIKLHISALENGAADFIVPPFEAAEIAHVMRRASPGEAWSPIRRQGEPEVDHF